MTNGLIRKKISAPILLLNVDASKILTPETSFNNDQITTNDDIEDIDALSSFRDTDGFPPILNSIDDHRPQGRPITQIYDSLTKSKTANEKDTSEYSNTLDVTNSTTHATTCFDDTERIKKVALRIESPLPLPLPQETPHPTRGLVTNRITPKGQLTKNNVENPPISDIWLLLEDSLVTSTTKKPTPVKKMMKFSHETKQYGKATNLGKKPQNKKSYKAIKKPVPNKRLRPLKPKPVVQEFTFVEPNQVIHTGKSKQASNSTSAADIEVLQTESLQESQKDNTLVNHDSVWSSSPTVKYKNRMLQRRSSRLKRKEIQDRANHLDSSDPITSNDSQDNYVAEEEEEEFISLPATKKRKVPDKEDTTSNKPKTTNVVVEQRPKAPEKAVSKESVLKESTRVVKDYQSEVAKANTMQPKGNQTEVRAQLPILTSKNSAKLIRREETDKDFHSKVHQGLNLISDNLINRMKLIQYEISRKELRLKDELDSKFKELDEFQKSQEDNFSAFIAELVSQMTNSELELERWIANNN